MRLSGTWNYKPVSIISGSTCESMQETHEDSCLVLRPFTRGSEHSTDGSMEHGCKSAVSSRSPQTIPFFLPCFRGFQTYQTNPQFQSSLPQDLLSPPLKCCFVTVSDNSIAFPAWAQVLQPYLKLLLYTSCTGSVHPPDTSCPPTSSTAIPALVTFPWRCPLLPDSLILLSHSRLSFTRELSGSYKKPSCETLELPPLPGAFTQPTV